VGLTARALAAGIGCHFTKVSRIENGNQAPAEDMIRAWYRVCRTEDQVPDLIATARAVESMYVEWRRQKRAGMNRLMLSSVPLYERTRLFRPPTSSTSSPACWPSTERPPVSW
jgi:transcriptional regulator with XRE-family HTH domain